MAFGPLLWGIGGHVILSVRAHWWANTRSDATPMLILRLEMASDRRVANSVAHAVVGERKETRTSAVNLPLGPYHPAISEPYALLLRLNGERVVAADQPALGYARRGVLDLIAGQPLDDALVVIERVCAQAGQAYRLALSIAVERATGAVAPRSAQLMRVFFAELEMTLGALWTLSDMARTLQLRGLRANGLEQRERIYTQAREATGERVYWGVAQPGGVRAGIVFEAARQSLNGLPEVVEMWRSATAAGGALRRATERVDAQLVKHAPEAPGCATRGSAEDARRSRPYDGYRAIALDWAGHGDVGRDETPLTLAALRLATRLKLSYDIMRVCSDTMGAATPTRMNAPMSAGQGSALIQTAHGPARIEVTVTAERTIGEARLRTGAADAFSHARDALVGQPLAHVPALLASQGLCASCADL